MTTIRELQQRCGTAARDKGFHEDRPYTCEHLAADEHHAEEYPNRLRDWQGNKLMLIVSEVAEAQDELRKGHAADLTYYPNREFDDRGTLKLNKPEGVPSELADVVIRVLDFCYTEGIDLEAIIEEKLAYNATREYKHGKKF
jgi:NTP pyrophosphatase (non-canonical NTP hydrolase)